VFYTIASDPDFDTNENVLFNYMRRTCHLFFLSIYGLTFGVSFKKIMGYQKNSKNNI